MSIGEYEQFQARKQDAAADLATAGGVSLDTAEMDKRYDAVIADIVSGGDGKIDFKDKDWEKNQARKLRRKRRAEKKKE